MPITPITSKLRLEGIPVRQQGLIKTLVSSLPIKYAQNLVGLFGGNHNSLVLRVRREKDGAEVSHPFTYKGRELDDYRGNCSKFKIEDVDIAHALGQFVFGKNTHGNFIDVSRALKALHSTRDVETLAKLHRLVAAESNSCINIHSPEGKFVQQGKKKSDGSVLFNSKGSFVKGSLVFSNKTPGLYVEGSESITTHGGSKIDVYNSEHLRLLLCDRLKVADSSGVDVLQTSDKEIRGENNTTIENGNELSWYKRAWRAFPIIGSRERRIQRLAAPYYQHHKTREKSSPLVIPITSPVVSPSGNGYKTPVAQKRVVQSGARKVV